MGVITKVPLLLLNGSLVTSFKEIAACLAGQWIRQIVRWPIWRKSPTSSNLLTTPGVLGKKCTIPDLTWSHEKLIANRSCNLLKNYKSLNLVQILYFSPTLNTFSVSLMLMEATLFRKKTQINSFMCAF